MDDEPLPDRTPLEKGTNRRSFSHWATSRAVSVAKWEVTHTHEKTAAEENAYFSSKIVHGVGVSIQDSILTDKVNRLERAAPTTKRLAHS